MNTVMYKKEREQAQDWCISVAASLAPAVAAGDRERLNRTVEDLIATRAVLYVAFADRSKEVLALGAATRGWHGVLGREGKTLRLEPLNQPTLIHGANQQVGAMDVTLPVYLPAAAETSPELVGYLRLGTEIAGTEAQLSLFSRKLQRASICLALLVLPIDLLVMRYVISPVNELARTTRAIADGSMEERARVSCGGEIGALAGSFNVMADRVSQTQQALMDLNADLEGRVVQRTRELKDLAARDPLTGLYNRRHFGEEMAREFAAAKRYRTDLTCLMFDMDHFNTDFRRAFWRQPDITSFRRRH